MRKIAIQLLLTAASVSAIDAQAQSVICYTVRDSAGKIIEQSTEAPVDMGKPLRQAAEDKYGPGSRLTTLQTDLSACPSTVLIEQATPRKRGDVDSFHSRHIENNPEVVERKARLEAAWAAKRAADIESLRGWKLRIGMTSDAVWTATRHPDCRSLANESKWCGSTDAVNTTRTAYGKTEQWVYRDGARMKFLYFTNGILTAIQD